MTASIPAHPSFSGTNQYQYDTKDQLTLETSTRNGGYTNNFGYDPAGNPTTFKGATATFNVNNQRTSDVHDGNGNPTTYKGATLTFDPENRMTAYGTVLTAGYRGDGLRAWKQTAAGRTYALYDGELLLAEMNASGTITSVNTWGTAGLVSRNSASSTVYYTFDPHGSVAQRQDGAGAVLTSHVWDAFGAGSSTGSSDDYGYAARWGYYTESVTGLKLVTHRYVDPDRGRLLTRDPIGYSGGVNLYAYVANNPVTRQDPTGLRAIWWEVYPQSPNEYIAGYHHAYIGLAGGTSRCRGASFGFWPGNPFVIDPGIVITNDPAENDPKFSRYQIADPMFEAYLCECVLKSFKNPPLYTIVYACGVTD